MHIILKIQENKHEQTLKFDWMSLEIINLKMSVNTKNQNITA